MLSERGIIGAVLLQYPRDKPRIMQLWAMGIGVFAPVSTLAKIGMPGVTSEFARQL